MPDKTRNMLVGNACVFIAIMLFSLNIPVVKIMAPEWMSTDDVTIARLVGACVLFWLAGLFVKKQPIAKGDFWRIFAGGGVSLFLFIYLLNVALKYGNAIDVSILMTLPPVFVILYQILFKHRKPGWMEVAGMVIAFAGAVIVIVSGHESEHASNPLLGDIIAIVCGIAYAAYLIILEGPTHTYRPVPMLKWVFLGAAIPCIAIGWAFPQAPIFHTHAGFMPWFWLVFLALGPSFLGYLFINPAIKLIGSELVSIYQYFMPVATSVIAVLLGQARFQWIEGVAIAVIICGMLLTDIGNRRSLARK